MAIWEIRRLLAYVPLAAGMVLGILCMLQPNDTLAVLAIVLLMLGNIPVIFCFESRSLLLILGGMFVFVAGVFQCWLLYTVSAPLAEEDLTEVRGTFASIRIIQRRGLDDYSVRLQGDGDSYRGLTFLDFPGEAISNAAREGDAVEILYSQGRRSCSIYAFRLNGRDFLTYETTCQARNENRRAAWFLLVIPTAVCGARLWAGFRGVRKQSRQRLYRYTGRRW